MKNEMTTFSNKQFGEVRTLMFGGEAWFVAKDVAKILGYAETSVMLRRLDDDEATKIAPTFIAGTNSSMAREFSIINESGLYNAIIGSKKPEAKAFRKWVTSEVLPSIRKHGAYMTPATIDDMVANPDLLIKLATTLKDEQAKNKALELKIDSDRHKTEFFDAVTDSKDSLDMGSVAKTIGGIGRNTLFAFLRNNGVLMDNNQPYQKYVDLGWFRTIEQKYNKPNGDICVNIKTVVFQKGVAGIIKLFKANNYNVGHNLDVDYYEDDCTERED